MGNSVWYLGPGASVANILSKMMTVYGTVARFDVLMLKFYGLQQDKGERISPFPVYRRCDE